MTTIMIVRCVLALQIWCHPSHPVHRRMSNAQSMLAQRPQGPIAGCIVRMHDPKQHTSLFSALFSRHHQHISAHSGGSFGVSSSKRVFRHINLQSPDQVPDSLSISQNQVSSMIEGSTHRLVLESPLKQQGLQQTRQGTSQIESTARTHGSGIFGRLPLAGSL